MTSDLRRGLATRVRVTNAICLVLGCVTSIYPPLYLAIGAPVYALSFLPFIACYFLLYRLNVRGHHDVARLGVVVAFNAGTTLYAVFFGIDAGIQLLFLPLAGFSFILFERRERLFVGFSAFLPMVLYLALTSISPPAMLALPSAIRDLVDVALAPSTFLILIAAVYYMQVANDNAERELSAAIDGRQVEIDRARQVFDSIADMIILKGERSELLWGNKAFRDYYELGPDFAQPKQEGAHVPAEVVNEYQKADMSVLQTGQNLVIEKEPIVRPDGVTRWFNTIKAPIRNAEGRPVMLVAVCRDITEQCETDRILEAQRTQMVATAKLSALGEMAAGIAHEINNPLAVIAGRAAGLRRHIERFPQEAEMKKAAVAIETMADRIATIIRGLGAFARNGDDDPFVLTPLKTIVDDSLTLCASRFKSNGVRLDVADLPADLAFECRPVQISQVLINLLANAFDAVEHLSDPWIQLACERRDDGLQITVTDSGTGLDAATRAKMFQPFFTTKAVGKGTGLGLSVTRNIVTHHRGSISLDPSTPHTRFVIWLPLQQAYTAQVAA